MPSVPSETANTADTAATLSEAVSAPAGIFATTEPGITVSGAASRKAREFARREVEILKVALDCLSTDNWESVTVAQIADQVGIAKGTMYLHFASKQEIYARLTLNFYRSLLDALQHLKKIGSGTLSQLIGSAFEFYLQRPKYRCVTQFCEREDFRCNLPTALAGEFDAMDKAFDKLITRELQRGVEQGIYRPVCTEQTILGIKCTFQGAINTLWCNRNGEQNSSQHFINTIINYMLAPIVVNQEDTTSDDRNSSTLNTRSGYKRNSEATHHE